MASRGHRRDFLSITLGVGGVFLLLAAYAQNWPPVLVVESNSMMHVDVNEYYYGVGDTRATGVAFGRFGTIDPGDLLLVKDVDSLDEVDTFAGGGDRHYGGRGDIVAYKRPGEKAGPIIVHRAMTLVTVEGDGASRLYTVQWSRAWRERGTCDQHPAYVCRFNATGVTITELGLTKRSFTRTGLITKGDNAFSNPGADQAGADPLMPQTVALDDIVGKAQLEAPAIGLLKLAFSGRTIKNAEMQQHEYYQRIGNVVAPNDLWALVLVELFVFAAAPIVVAVVRDYARKPEGRPVVRELSVLEDRWKSAADRRAKAVPSAPKKAAATTKARPASKGGPPANGSTGSPQADRRPARQQRL